MALQRTRAMRDDDRKTSVMSTGEMCDVVPRERNKLNLMTDSIRARRVFERSECTKPVPTAMRRSACVAT